MNIVQPWQLLLVTIAGWINRWQQDVIAYIQEESRTLRSKLKGKRIRFTDDERRCLAVKGKVLGRQVLPEVASIVMPDTIVGPKSLIVRSLICPNSRIQAGADIADAVVYAGECLSDDRRACA